MRHLTLGIDVGGTFTDFVLLDEEKKSITVGKLLTTPQDPSLGVLEGTKRLLDKIGVSITSLHYAVHGTTLVANVLIERRGAKTGLISTQGFRDTLEIGRELRYDLYDLFIERPEPLVPRYLRREVSERVAWDGRVLRPLNQDELKAVAQDFQQEGIIALAICFLHSYRNPTHEQAARAFLAEHFPRFQVCLSSEVAPEIREYDRTSTTVGNAYVQPLMKGYLGHLQAKLHEMGLRGELYIMLSGGGITTVPVAEEFPIRLVESGPAAGAIASAFYGQLIDKPDLISFDMGGTTAKICLITRGQPSHAHEFEAARVRRFKKGSGLLVKVPVVEMIEIGAGGGSIAHLDPMGLLKVGPQSAGADPGPACYGRGGTEPTVTDADLILGYLDADYFLGGEMALDQAAAEQAIKKLADAMGIGIVEAALGIHDVVNDNMATATRIHIAERGLDPRRYSLMAFGGAGPVHAYRVAKLLKLKEVICPLGAGTTSALGLLVAPMSFDFVQSYVARLDNLDWEHLNHIFANMEGQAAAMLAQAGVPPERITMARSAEMRYVGQGYEIPVPIPAGQLTPEQLEAIKGLFYSSYEKLFDRYLTDVPVEALTWRLAAAGPPPAVDLRFATDGPSRYKDGIKGRRQIFIPELKDFVECAVYDRYSLTPGMAFRGPAVVEEKESTVIVGPEATAKIDDYLNLIMELP